MGIKTMPTYIEGVFDDVSVGQIFFYMGVPYIKTNYSQKSAVCLGTGGYVEFEPFDDVIIPDKITLTYSNTEE